jgi:large subunit ribosomal protein L9
MQSKPESSLSESEVRRKDMANTTVLLREDIDHLGGRGEIVKVKAGYARNYLLPQKLATLATKGNIRQIEQERAALLKKAAVEKATAEAQKEQMSSISLSFARKTGEHGHLFGSVTSMDIAEALKAQGYEIDRRKVSLREPIKETGEYSVNVKLHREVTIAIPVKVTDEEGNIIAREPEEKSGKRKSDKASDASSETSGETSEAADKSAADEKAVSDSGDADNSAQKPAE